MGAYSQHPRTLLASTSMISAALAVEGLPGGKTGNSGIVGPGNCSTAVHRPPSVGKPEFSGLFSCNTIALLPVSLTQ